MSAKKSFWDKRIDNAAKRGHFFETDRKMALEWPTCACGEQDPRIPRHRDGAPEDARLARLGKMFNSAVNFNHIADARTILREIEDRAAEVLAEAAK